MLQRASHYLKERRGLGIIMHKDDSDEVPEQSHQSKLLNLQKYEKAPQETINT